MYTKIKLEVISIILHKTQGDFKIEGIKLNQKYREKPI